MRVNRKIVQLLTLSLFTAVACVAAPGNALADPPPPCSGASCVGYSPSDVNGRSCAGGASTLDSVTNLPGGGPDIELRWSSYCRANWARVSYATGLTWWAESYDGVRAYGSDQALYSVMVDGSQLARVCIVPGGYSIDSAVCTAWH